MLYIIVIFCKFKNRKIMNEVEKSRILSIVFHYFTFYDKVYFVGAYTMENKLAAKDILQQLGITKRYSGYDYILHGIDLIMHDEAFLTNITKVLYIDIAKKYHTSHTCVERNIRKVIEVIWKHAEDNQPILDKYFGASYLNRKPSNKEFFQLLSEYIKLHNIQEKLLYTGEFICPISQDVCIAYKKIMEQLNLL